MIEVFKTNVQGVYQAEKLLELLLLYFPDSCISFDLDDCDRVLRIKGENFTSVKVIKLLEENGVECVVLQ